jgi:predicted kinase
MGKRFARTVIINRAVPGSGKTTLSRNIASSLRGAGLSIANHSTDDFFMADGRYCFDLTRLYTYHQWNRLSFEQSLRRGTDVVICDNTNLQPWQSAPYTDLARRFGYQIIFLNLTPRELWKHVAAQQVTAEKPDAHGVPEECLAQFIRDFNEYDPLLHRENPVDPALHHHYIWNRRKLCPEPFGPAAHFDLDHLVTVRPAEYHEAKKHIGEDFLELIRKSA